MMFDEANDVVFFRSRDQSVVMIECLYGRLGYKNVNAPLNCIGRDFVMSIWTGSRVYRYYYVSKSRSLSGVKMITASPGLS